MWHKRGKLPLAANTSIPYWSAGSSGAALLLTQFPASAPWETADDGPNLLGPYHLHGRPNRNPDSWLQTGLVPGTAGI